MSDLIRKVRMHKMGASQGMNIGQGQVLTVKQGLFRIQTSGLGFRGKQTDRNSYRKELVINSGNLTYKDGILQLKFLD